MKRCLGMLLLLMLLGGVAMAREFRLSFTVDLMVGHHAWFDIPYLVNEPALVVKVLKELTGFNTLYVIYGGQVNPLEAVEIFGKWFEAGKAYHVEVIPVLSLINIYFAREKPHLIYPNSGSVPKVDLRLEEVKKEYGFLVEEIDSRYAPNYFGVFEFNEFAAATIMGEYPRIKTTEALDWIEYLGSKTRAKKAVSFMQPWAVTLRWVKEFDLASLDTYGFLRDETWDELESYAQKAASVFKETDGDLIILDDYGGEIPALRQRKAAQILKECGVTGFNMDFIIIAHVLWYKRGEDFWTDLLSDGSYEGVFKDSFNEVCQIYRENQRIEEGVQ